MLIHEWTRMNTNKKERHAGETPVIRISRRTTGVPPVLDVLFVFIRVHSWTILLLLSAFTRGAESEWVHPGPDGKLTYKSIETGDHILDFSHAGYQGGGVALPDVPVKQTLQPCGKDDDTAIQSALDEVSKLPLENHFRGAVLLSPGTFTCSKTIYLSTSGIVLRGSGANATTIKMTGPKHQAIILGKPRGAASNDEEPAPTEPAVPKKSEPKTTITDPYVPSGATSFTVASCLPFAVGDSITIRRPTTAAWIHLMHMDDLKRDGKPQTWIGTSRSEITQRKITAIDGNKITIDAPLSDSYDAKYLGQNAVTITKLAQANSLSHLAVENLHIQCPPIETDYGHHPWSAIRVAADDCFVRNVYCEETMNSTTLAGHRITFENVSVTHTYPNLGASKPADFSIEGSQILLDRCSSTGGNTYWVWTSSLITGPNVVLNSVFRGHGSRIQPHQRWSTGLLIDNCTCPDGNIDFANRGVAGSGHGWTMGFAVAWNSIAKTFIIQQPPGSANWAIGCIGDRQQTARYFDSSPILPEGCFDSHGTPVTPQSLYLAQLQDRLGAQALKNLGYTSNTIQEFPTKSTPPLPPLSRDDDPILGPDLALHRPVNAAGARGAVRQSSGENAVDGDPRTSWSPDPDTRPSLELDLEGPVDVNAIVLEEPDTMHNIRQFKVEAQVDSDWKLLTQGTTIGPRLESHFPKTPAWKIRLTIEKSEGTPAIRKFGLYSTR
jgi:hypothetical protein